MLWHAKEAKKVADSTAFITAEESGDAVGLIPTVRKKHSIEAVDRTLTTELTFKNMNYRKAVATLRPTDQLIVSYHSYCYESCKQFTPKHLLQEVSRLTVVFHNGRVEN